MTQAEKRIYLIRRLLDERPQEREVEIPQNTAAQKRLLRTLMNLRPPRAADADFLKIQDEYLKAETAAKGITDSAQLSPVGKDLYLWQGDITALACDAIVNAANSEMLGCFCPCHGCIDNAIHTYAGVQLRLKCAEIRNKQGHREETGNGFSGCLIEKHKRYEKRVFYLHHYC